MTQVLTRRHLLVSSALLTLGGTVKAAETVFAPEDYGARGDGTTDDSEALARMAAAVTLNGGGTVVLRRTTYLVGRQWAAGAGKYAFPPMDLLAFRGCRAPLIVRGNGARLKAAPGLRYGIFDRDGTARRTRMPFLGDGLASPYRAMIEVTGCTGPVEIRDIELAGPGDAVTLGGQYGDTGWQIPASGLHLAENRGSELVSGVYSHHHLLDGVIIDGLDETVPTATRRLEGVRAEDNGRQGCSIVGGRGYRFVDCSFSRSGRRKVRSAPGAGVDVEAENGKRIRDIGFTDCTFADNWGAGMVADSGDSEDVSFDGCTFVGTTSWSAWPRKPAMRFVDCVFVGAVSNAYGSEVAAMATRFTRCLFTDDPQKAPRGEVFGGTHGDRPLADISTAQNVLFDRCRFDATHGGTLPWSTRAIYSDCTMVQRKGPKSFPRGTFRGRNTIVGDVDLYGSRIPGTLNVNGVARDR